MVEFGVCGLSNGLAIMADKDSWSVWDHITGECFQGTHTGRRLDFWPMAMTTVEAALADYPDITISLSNFKSLRARFFQFVHRNKISGRNFIPAPFFRTMKNDIDTRQDRLEQGLGVIVGNEGKFYPVKLIKKGGYIDDIWHGRPLRIERGAIDGVPFATWLDTEEPPMQLLTRWYGFSFTYPECEIYEERLVANRA